ncbi:cyclin-domain-containing protein [Pilaira anomala]|nr:cyclin-domain-containing protein [Pilaira anomala]
MSISYYSDNKRCTDPNLYSLKNLPNHHAMEKNTTYLAPLLMNEKQPTEEKTLMIDRLIEAAADIIDSIRSKRNTVAMTTIQFIREILKRSRATYSMLQLALFYMFRLKKTNPFVNCSRRIFLAALMTASKYLNDKNYKNKAWAKITCLSVAEINTTEIVFLKLIDYQLFVSKPLYEKWVSLLHEHIRKKHSNPIKKLHSPNIQLPSPNSITSDFPSPVLSDISLIHPLKRSRSPSLNSLTNKRLRQL